MINTSLDLVPSIWGKKRPTKICLLLKIPFRRENARSAPWLFQLHKLEQPVPWRGRTPICLVLERTVLCKHALNYTIPLTFSF